MRERGTFFRFQVYERVRVSLVNGYKREGAVISVREKDLKGPVDAFYGCKRGKKTFWFNTFKKKKKSTLFECQCV